jgi:hypothetical protein
MERIREVGEIVVKVYRGGEAEDTTKTAVAQPVELRGVKGSVHEKALKRDAKSHRLLPSRTGPAPTAVRH